MRKLFTLLFLFGGLLLFSCKKKSDTSGTDTYYFKATINGQAIDLTATVPVSNEFAATSSTKANANFGTGWTTDFYTGSEICKMSGFNAVPPAGSVFILKRFNAQDPTAAEEKAMVAVGTYPYGKSLMSSSTVNGAVVEYVDATGETWTSELGSQTGSTFVVTSVYANPDGTTEKIWEATFSCKLYKQSNPSATPLTVANGALRGLLF